MKEQQIPLEALTFVLPLLSQRRDAEKLTQVKNISYPLNTIMEDGKDTPINENIDEQALADEIGRVLDERIAQGASQDEIEARKAVEKISLEKQKEVESREQINVLPEAVRAENLRKGLRGSVGDAIRQTAKNKQELALFNSQIDELLKIDDPQAFINRTQELITIDKKTQEKPQVTSSNEIEIPGAETEKKEPMSLTKMKYAFYGPIMDKILEYTDKDEDSPARELEGVFDELGKFWESDDRDTFENGMVNLYARIVARKEVKNLTDKDRQEIIEQIKGIADPPTQLDVIDAFRSGLKDTGDETDAGSLIETLNRRGKDIISIVASGTGRVDEYYQMLQEYLKKPDAVGSIKSDLEELFNDIRNDVVRIEQAEGEGSRRAIWRARDGDVPVIVTGRLGKGPDGKMYYATNSDIFGPGGVSEDELEFVADGETTPEQDSGNVSSTGNVGGGAKEPPNGRRTAFGEEPGEDGNGSEGKDANENDGEPKFDNREKTGGEGGFADFDVSKFEGNTELKELGEFIRAVARGERDMSQFSRSDQLQDLYQLYQKAIEKDRFTLDIRKRLINEAQRKLYTPDGGARFSFDESERFRFEFQAREVGESLNAYETNRNNPESIQQVATQIIMAEGEGRWGKDGAYPLLDRDNNIIERNFLQWVRERMMYQHKNNARDPNLQLTQLIGIDNAYNNTISIFAMDKNRNKYFRDQLTGRVYDELAEQLKTEVWLFGQMRNYNLIYNQYKGQDKEIASFLAQVHQKEELTSGDSLERILTLSEKYIMKYKVQALEEEENKKAREAQERGEEYVPRPVKDTKVGDSVRKSIEIYYNIADIKELRRILGEDSIFFKKEGFENALRIINGQPQDAMLSATSRAYVDRFFKNGSNELDIETFITVINPFNQQDKPEQDINFSREMVRQAVSKMYGLDYGLDKSTESVMRNNKFREAERDLARINLEYAETWAWVLSSFTGIAARNDVNAVGFDMQSKLRNFLAYRIKSSSKTRASAYGNRYNLGVHRQLAEDFFNGIFVQQKPENFGEQRESPYRIFMKIDEVDREIIRQANGRDFESLSFAEQKEIKRLMERKQELSGIRFDTSTQISYVNNHLVRTLGIYQDVMSSNEGGLDQIVKWEQKGLSGRYVIDNTKFSEFKESAIKSYRYAFNTYPQLDFGEIERAQDGFEKKLNEEGKWVDTKIPRYIERVKADAFFGPVVTYEFKQRSLSEKMVELETRKRGGQTLTSEEERMRKGNFTDGERLGLWSSYVRNNREVLWKRAFMARTAKDLLSHRIRSRKNTYSYKGYDEVRLMYEALQSILEEEITGETAIDINFKPGAAFLSRYEIDWIKKHSRSEDWRIIAMDISPEVAGGIFSGFGKGLKQLFADIMK